MRLQSAPRRIQTGKNRGQADCDDFNYSITRGFTAVGEPKVAVCLLPGTEIAFEKNSNTNVFSSILPNKNNSAATGAVSADQHGQPYAPRCVGITGRADGVAHPAVRRPTCDRAAVARPLRAS